MKMNPQINRYVGVSRAVGYTDNLLVCIYDSSVVLNTKNKPVATEVFKITDDFFCASRALVG